MRAHTTALLSCVVLMLFVTLGGMAQTLHAALGIWFTEIFLFLGVAHVGLRWQRLDFVSYLGLRRFSWFEAGVGWTLGMLNFVALVAPIQFLAQKILPESWREISEVAKLFDRQRPWELALILLSVSIAAPICEEIFFRGVLQQGLQQSGVRVARAVGVSAVIFSAFHLDPVGFFARVELAVLFSFLFLRTGSLWPGIFAHAANNFVSSVLYFATRDEVSVETTGEEPTFGAVLLVASVGLSLLIGFWSLVRGRLPVNGVVLPAFEASADEAMPEKYEIVLLMRWIAAGGVGLLVILWVSGLVKAR